MPRQTGAATKKKVAKKAPSPQSSVSYQKAPALRKARSARRDDGVQEVITTPEGLSIAAEYRNGQFHRWVARNAQGKALPITFQKTSKPKSGSSLEQLRAPQDEVIIEVCYLCLRNPLPTGPRIICYEIPCS